VTSHGGRVKRPAALDPPAVGALRLGSAAGTSGSAVAPDKGDHEMTSNAAAVLPAIVAEHIDAVNSLDTDRIVSTFAPDAYVNDNRREIWGADAIRKFISKEFVGDHVTMEVREVIDHHGDIIVRAKYDGTYDTTNLPDELILTSYFSIREGKIVSLAIIFNQPSPY
jgi:hypothetical protein